VLPLAGFLASQGRLSVLLTIVAATVGSVLGALALYELGARVGSARLHRWVDRMPLLEEEDLDKGRGLVPPARGGSVLLGRCIPVVRSLISVPAGVERMPHWRFLLLTTLGSGVWNSFFVLAGYALGSRFGQVGEYSSYLNYAIYAAIVMLLALALRRVLMRRRTA
jgi:membrane protein DedA with SNARE-associated domain